MTAPTREAIMTALFSSFDSSTAFKTKTRRWQAWQDDPQAHQPDLPLLVQYEMNEDYIYTGRGIPPIRTMDVSIMLYGKIPAGQTIGTADKTTPGASVLNPLIDAVETALAPDPLADGVQTLGGLVYDCRIEGTVIKALGDADPSGICAAIIPLKLLLP